MWWQPDFARLRPDHLSAILQFGTVQFLGGKELRVDCIVASLFSGAEQSRIVCTGGSMMGTVASGRKEQVPFLNISTDSCWMIGWACTCKHRIIESLCQGPNILIMSKSMLTQSKAVAPPAGSDLALSLAGLMPFDAGSVACCRGCCFDLVGDVLCADVCKFVVIAVTCCNWFCHVGVVGTVADEQTNCCPHWTAVLVCRSTVADCFIAHAVLLFGEGEAC